MAITQRNPQRAAAWRIALSGGGAVAALGTTALASSGGTALIAAGPVFAGWLLYAVPQLRAFMPAIEVTDVGELVRELGLPLDYTPRAYVAEPIYREAGLLHGDYDVYTGSHLIEGTLAGCDVRLSKLRVARREAEPRPTAAGRPSGLPDFRPVFQGLFYAIALAEPVDGRLVAVPRPRDGAPARCFAGEAVQLGDLAFDAVYAVHTSDPALARRWLTPARRSALLALVLEADRPLEVALAGERAYLAVPGARAFLESVHVRAESDPSVRERVRRELAAILAIPRTLGLIGEHAQPPAAR